jgi:hypothetical protein
MPAIYTDSQILALQGMRIQSFYPVVTDKYHYSSSNRDNSDYRRSYNMSSIMDKRTRQGDYALLEFSGWLT